MRGLYLDPPGPTDKLEECAYFSTNGGQAPSPQRRENRSDGEERKASITLSRPRADWSSQPTPVLSSRSSLAELFGYFEDSDSNTLALIRRLGVGHDDSCSGKSPGLTPEAAEEVHRIVERMPDRQILDFLVKYFAAEVNCLNQDGPEVDFAVLILRICSYASQFLPSPGYTLDKIRGVLLADIRNTCDETADSLAAIGRALDSRGSLIRVQHLAFYGLRCQMEGRRNDFWESLSRAVQVAQTVGLHSEAARSRPGMDEIDKEMERRTFCNLFIWDSSLSRQLDRIPFLPDCLGVGNWPQMHLGGGETAEDMTDFFTERVLQARLAEFWSTSRPRQGPEFDMIISEERYDEFCREYIAKLPPAFALDPVEMWDKRVTKLLRQRQLLHIAIFDSLCWNFRPLLLRPPEDQNMPSYKRVLLGAQKKALAVAALCSLQAATQLHAMLGGSHTRFAGLIFSTFEAAVLLVTLCSDPQFPSTCPGGFSSCDINPKTDPLRAGMPNVSRQKCINAVQSALNRLRMLAEVSSAADMGATVLSQLMSKMYETGSPMTNGTETKDVTTSQSQDIAVATTTATVPLAVMSDVTNGHSFSASDPPSFDNFISMNAQSSITDIAGWPSLDPSTLQSRDDFISISAAHDLHGSWATPIIDFSY
ncbi:Pyrimidine pathway regulatory protein 1 [Talaromyces islandicus]|uniref:Pyrimidine pathway regulatory protein 1 n=1 Tax=Talaromyces islandicus TaxID=28573 RepID=A0A0U1MCI6_TALIS|nr:Pyrimidine pathway regulatory protein 1 [Talaromyces islandicus]